MGAENRKDPTGIAAGAGASASTSLVLGALLDGIAESAAIGVSLLGGGSVGTAVVIAVFLSNIPESLSASAGMKRDGRSVGYILRLWVLVVVASTVAAALGYGLLGSAGETTLALTEAFAAGAVLTMLATRWCPRPSSTPVLRSAWPVSSASSAHSSCQWPEGRDARTGRPRPIAASRG